MKLLLSCYECSPVRGSECGIGWNWAYEARRLGHDVWVLVSPTYEAEVRQACETDALAASISWHFPQSPYWRLAAGYRPKAERRHNFLWQIAALKAARRLSRDIQFDAVQQVTWAGLRVPSFLWRLPVPFILGPVGGGETSPASLRDVLSPRNRLVEWVRDLSNATLMLNPPMRLMLNAAKVIAARSPETRALLPARLHDKTILDLGIGMSEEHIGSPRDRISEPPRLLFVARLLYWKGTHLALAAFEQVCRKLPDARFTVVGRGPEETRLRELAHRLGIAGKVSFVPWMEQANLFKLYKEYDLFLFPSLHDSGGLVVLEALCRGLPVVCLDLGGPKEIVDETCGAVVRTTDLNSAQVATGIAETVLTVVSDRERWRALSNGAVARARSFSWPERVAGFYRTVEPYLS